jgi:competence transcription factor ComK
MVDKSKVLELFDNLMEEIYKLETTNPEDADAIWLNIDYLENYTRTELLKQKLCDCEKD